MSACSRAGGEWCGLTVKVSRKSYVVGPQADALHLAYLPPEPAQAAQPVPDGAEVINSPENRVAAWRDLAERAAEVVSETDRMCSALLRPGRCSEGQ